jgi:hypothetical protein
VINDDEGVSGRAGRTMRRCRRDGVPVSRPLDHLPQRVLLLLLLLSREAELAVDQVDSPRARALVRRGLTDGARVSLPCSPARRQANAGARPWMCQARQVA